MGLIDTSQGLRFIGGSAPTGADDLGQRLEQLNAIGASLSAERDIHRLGEYFDHRGLHLGWDRIAQDLWTAWMFADLVPEELRGEIAL